MSNDETPTIAPAAPEGPHLTLDEAFRLYEYWYDAVCDFEDKSFDHREVAKAIIDRLLTDSLAMPHTK